MRFLADMGISPGVVDALRAAGHHAIHLWDQGLGRLTDEKILAKAHDEKYVLLTADLGFGKLMSESGQVLPSIVLFRLASMRPAKVNPRLAVVLSDCAEDLAAGAFVVVTESTIRVRRLPIGQGE